MVFVETSVSLPVNLIEQKQLYYIYVLETSDPNDINSVISIHEKLFTEMKHIRVLNLDLKKGSKNTTEFKIQIVNFSQFDGLVLFDNQLTYSLPNDLLVHKKRLLENEKPIQKLENIFDHIDYAERTWNLLEDIQRVYECLCINDYDCKEIFEEVISDMLLYYKIIIYFLLISLSPKL